MQLNSIVQPSVSVQSMNKSSSLTNETQGKTNEKKPISNTSKIIAGTAALALLGTAIYFGIRGKNTAKLEAKFQELINNGEMNETYLRIFKDTNKLNGEEFIKAAYNKLADAVGLAKKPELIIKPHQASCKSSFDSIELCLGGLKTKADQFNFIRHELEHAKQTEMMYRAFGKDALLDAYAQRAITHLKMNPLYCSQEFNTSKFDEIPKEKLQLFIEKCKSKLVEKTGFLDEIVKEKGKILQNTPEYEEAQKYMKAARNYKSPGMLNGINVVSSYFEQIMKEYKNNLLEANAFREGENIRDMYLKFLKLINKYS